LTSSQFDTERVVSRAQVDEAVHGAVDEARDLERVLGVLRRPERGLVGVGLVEVVRDGAGVADGLVAVDEHRDGAERRVLLGLEAERVAGARVTELDVEPLVGEGEARAAREGGRGKVVEDAHRGRMVASRAMNESKQPGLLDVDVNEYGGKKDGARQSMNRRLFMQLLVFDVPPGQPVDRAAERTAALLRERKIPGVVYADSMAPRGVGLLTWSEDPAHFVEVVRPLFATSDLDGVVVRPGWSMIGRTYATGYEPDLEFWLLRRAVEHVMKDEWPWHVWYPLRRTGAFARLPREEQGAILREHAALGIAYGQKGLAHDVRLACHGLDPEDNEFVIGLVSGELHPLSHLVQAMRATRQTSEFIAKMGPFFVGRALHRSAG
jgi:chlorite dismutase